mgnify:CR=1 FL=1
MSEPMMRMTKQRAAVLKCLETDDAFRSAQQVHQALEEAGEPVGLATVYRNLQALEDAGRVDTVRGPDGEQLFRLCGDIGHHHHLVCRECGKTQEISLGGLEQELVALVADSGYSLTTHQLEIFGICEDCA